MAVALCSGGFAFASWDRRLTGAEVAGSPRLAPGYQPAVDEDEEPVPEDELPLLDDAGQGCVVLDPDDGVVVDPEDGVVVAVELDEDVTAAWVKMFDDAAVALVAAEATP